MRQNLLLEEQYDEKQIFPIWKIINSVLEISTKEEILLNQPHSEATFKEVFREAADKHFCVNKLKKNSILEQILMYH